MLGVWLRRGRRVAGSASFVRFCVAADFNLAESAVSRAEKRPPSRPPITWPSTPATPLRRASAISLWVGTRGQPLRVALRAIGFHHQALGWSAGGISASHLLCRRRPLPAPARLHAPTFAPGTPRFLLSAPPHLQCVPESLSAAAAIAVPTLAGMKADRLQSGLGALVTILVPRTSRASA